MLDFYFLLKEYIFPLFIALVYLIFREISNISQFIFDDYFISRAIIIIWQAIIAVDNEDHRMNYCLSFSTVLEIPLSCLTAVSFSPFGKSTLCTAMSREVETTGGKTKAARRKRKREREREKRDLFYIPSDKTRARSPPKRAASNYAM